MAVVELNDAGFQESLSNDKKVIVKFYADWCGSCKLFKPKFRRLSEEEDFAGVTFIDINAEENPEARKLAEVNNLPTIATFKDGKLLESVATSKEEAVREMLSKFY